MAEDIEKQLAKYAARTKNHATILRAANDPLLLTDDLIEKGLEAIACERANLKPNLFPLLILQQRTTPEVVEKAYGLLEGDDPEERQLGCRILREFPQLDQAPYTHSVDAIKALGKMIVKEEDEDVLFWGLSAVGWQCHIAGLDILLSRKNDPSIAIRAIVANSLLMVCSQEGGITDVIALSFLEFAKDLDEDIRWSVFYDIAEYPDLFGKYTDLFLKITEEAMNDESTDVQEQAENALIALRELVKRGRY